MNSVSSTLFQRSTSRHSCKVYTHHLLIYCVWLDRTQEPRVNGDDDGDEQQQQQHDDVIKMADDDVTDTAADDVFVRGDDEADTSRDDATEPRDDRYSSDQRTYSADSASETQPHKHTVRVLVFLSFFQGGRGKLSPLEVRGEIPPNCPCTAFFFG